MYHLILERTINGKIIGRCEINGFEIVTRPKASISKVMDEIRHVADLLDELIDDDTVFEVTWVK